jgi:type I restriction enzyme, S subunit
MSGMNFLEKLLDGSAVEWKTLGEVSRLITKGTTPKKFIDSGINFVKTESLEDGRMNPQKFMFVSQETHEKELRRSILEANDILFAIAGSIGKCTVVEESVLPANTNQALAIIRLDETVNVRFVFYCMQTLAMKEYIAKYNKASAQPNLNLQQIGNFPIPIPCPDNPDRSLAIQAEIVRILDTFTELTAELGDRQKQYNYYRDRLLTFEEGEAEWKPLGEIGEFIRGKRFTKADYVDDGIPVIHYGEIYTQYGVSTSHALSQVRAELAASLRYAEPGDVVITDVGETVEDVGKAVAWIGNEKVAIRECSEFCVRGKRLVSKATWK